MAREEGFDVMSVEAAIANDAKFKKLARHAPEKVGVAGWVYIATMGASWTAGRRVSVEDAWPAYMPFDQLVVDGLRHVGLVDRKGFISPRAWRRWFEPARERREKSRADWREWQRKHRQQTGMSGA